MRRTLSTNKLIDWLTSPMRVLKQWFDGHDAGRGIGDDDDPSAHRVDWPRIVPFVLMHLACLSVFLVGFSWIAFGVMVSLYLMHMFIITAFYHRYFSHRSFKTSRAFQLLMAVLGCTAVQRSPLWWAAHHRHHHAHSDQEADSHSPHQHGFLFSHTGWFLTKSSFPTKSRLIRDWLKYPELRWLDRYDVVPVVVFAVSLFLLGLGLQTFVPQWGTSGLQMLVWGFVISTVVCYHATYTINSLAHKWGSRRYATDDDSRNNLWLALLTLGEGWHNNHHHYPSAARQGFYWWEIDLTYYGLILLSKLGIIWDLKPVPEKALNRNRIVPHRAVDAMATTISPGSEPVADLSVPIDRTL